MSSADRPPRRCYTRDQLLALRHSRQLPPHVTRIRCAAFVASNPPPGRRPSPPPSPPPGFAHVQLPPHPSPPRSPSPPPEDRSRSRIARAPYMPDNFATRIAFHATPNPSASPLTSQEIDALFDTSAPFEPYPPLSNRLPISNGQPAPPGVARFTHFRQINPSKQPSPILNLFQQQPVKPHQPPPALHDQLDDAVLSFFNAIRARAISDDPVVADVHDASHRDSYSVPNTLTKAHKVAPAQPHDTVKSGQQNLQDWYARLAQQTMQ